MNWGHVGRMVTTLRRHGGTMVIAGSVRRPNLWKMRPDLGFLLSLPQILEMMAGGGDDSVLSRVVRFFEAKGIEVRGAHEVAPDLLASAGPAGALALDAGAQADAELGFAVRTALGPLDAGQAVVVAGGKVLAIEGAEGTDAMLARAGSLRDARTGAARSGVLTKGPKPGQELRVDMPAIGPRTVEGVAAAGLAGVAVEAGAVLLLDREQAVQAADSSGVAVVGLTRSSLPRSPMAPATPSPARSIGRFVGLKRPNTRADGDIEKALAAIAVPVAFRGGPGRGRGAGVHPGDCGGGARACHARAHARAEAVGRRRQAEGRRGGVPRRRIRVGRGERRSLARRRGRGWARRHRGDRPSRCPRRL